MRTAAAGSLLPVIFVLRLFASLKLAVALIVAVAVALFWGTILEKFAGHQYALWYVYHSSWFVALLGLLAVNLLAALLMRFPWKKKQIGFVLAHVGLLVLLAGSLATFHAGIEGQLSFHEGEAANVLHLTDHNQFTIFRQQQHGADGQLPGALTFRPGPSDWPDDKTQDLGEVHGAALKVLKFYHHAQVKENWVKEEPKRGGPALRLSLAGADGQQTVQEWLVAEQLGSPLVVGSAKLELRQAPVKSIEEDFLQPPGKDMDKSGVLSMHYEDHMYRVPVSENVGKKVPVGETGVEVEIVQYFPAAKPSSAGRFVSEGDTPKNPLLELLVHLPDNDKPIRQIAFAKFPWLNLDGIHGWNCPVKFWYRHPAVAPDTGAEFLQTPDGNLYCRLAIDGKYQPHGAVQQGDVLEIPQQLKITVLDYLPSARREVSFTRVPLAADETAGPEAAALVEVAAGSTTRQVWLGRNDAEYGRQILETPEGLLAVMFGYERIPLGFSLELLRFKRGMNPGRMGDASFASSVKLVDKTQGIDELCEISMNQPLVHGKFTFYQSSFQEVPGESKVSVLTVSYDPGRLWKYLGSTMICLGIFITYYLKASLLRKLPFLGSRRQTTANGSTAAYQVTAVLLACLALAAPAMAGSTTGPSFNWEPWRYLPVQDGGRYKPLDTLAGETLRTITSGTSFVDPETHQPIDGVALYLALLFDWQGGEQASDPHSSAPAVYFLGHKADKWDRAPLVRVEYPPLGDALGLAHGQKYISPLDLGTAKFHDPETGKELPFLLWARHNEKGSSLFDRKALELANNFWTYREHRMGRGLALLPVQGGEHEQWLSLAELLRSPLDAAADPTGGLRKAKEQFQQARAAHAAGSAEAFNEASAALLATLQEYGPQLGVYPSAKTIELEVAYNRWAPFRLAWVLAMLALLGALLSMGFGWKPFYVTSLAIFCAAVLTMLVGFAMRIGISARAPVTNMYESVLSFGLGAAIFGLVFEWIYRNRYVLTAAAAVATVALVLADNCPAVLDPGIRPLPPVLRSNFWLATHVITIMLSYAAFALALVIGDITLGFYLARSSKRATTAALSKFTYNCLQAGVLLLTLGTFLGAAWADYAWGRFWGWDPKEVFALITLLGYLAIVHARCAGWVRELGLAALSVSCFALVVIAWYGVNFWWGTGLHSYGFGTGGQMYVAGVLLAQLLYVIVATLRAAPPQAPSTVETPAVDATSSAAYQPAGSAQQVAS